MPKIPRIPIYAFPMNFQMKRQYQVDISESPNTSAASYFLEKINTKYNAMYKLFTDGSKRTTGTGAAFYDPQTQVKCMFKLPIDASIFTAELVAIKLAIQYAANLHTNSIAIFSDSQSSLKHLQRLGKHKDRLTNEIVNAIQETVSRGVMVHLVWVKAHVNIRPNEEADEAAARAIREGTPVHFHSNLDLKRRSKINMYQKWNTKYSENSEKKGEFYLSVQPTIPRHPWFCEGEFDRKSIRIISRLRFNHHRLPAHLYKIGLLEDPKCPCNNVDEGDANHTLLQCAKYNRQRVELLNDLIKENIEFPTNSCCLMQHKTIYSAIVKFIKSTEIEL
uniref:Gag-Pol polyprotein n=2 Tax=Lygus hesperus TaxID=30085 RepID=A0A0A9XZ92_LYGHE